MNWNKKPLTMGPAEDGRYNNEGKCFFHDSLRHVANMLTLSMEVNNCVRPNSIGDLVCNLVDFRAKFLDCAKLRARKRR